MKLKNCSLITEPSDARIHLVRQDGSLQLIGTGRAEYRIKKSNTNSIVVSAKGFESKQWNFVRRGSYPSQMVLALDMRIVSINSNVNAQIFLGDTRIGIGSAQISIPPNTTVTVEARLDGFWPSRAEYSTNEDSGVLPLDDFLDITDRMIVVSARPPNSSIWVDSQFAGDNFAEVRLPQNTCVTIGTTAGGFVGKEEVFCNQERMDVPPKAHTIFLTDRKVTVRTVPQTASILVNGRVVGTDEYSIVVAQEKCIDVGIEQDGYVGQTRHRIRQTTTLRSKWAISVRSTMPGK